MSKYTGEYNYKGKLTRVSTDKVLKTAYYTYELNGRTWHIKSKPWVNRYGYWEAKSGGGERVDSANYLWLVVANIDRNK